MSAPPTADAVRAALGRVLDPEIRRPIADLDMVDGVTVEGGTATVDLALTIVGCPAADRIEREAREAALTVPGVERAEVRLAV
ncbi:MAG TPA: iron-sulfur cluster assembly protein, partial [Pseudolysinimonas sp.]|nr:iron-sulfur cluster assembly protein [Pseudolysinimonas sp.]